MTTGSTIDTRTYRRAIDTMLDEFAALPELTVKTRDQRIIQIAYGWCAQVHRFARAVLCMVDNGFGYEAGLVVRSMLEYTITLHWFVQAGDRAVDAVSRRHQVSLGAIKRSAQGGGEEMIPFELVAQVLSHDVPKVDEEETLRNFEAICRELGVDHNLYVVYRIECGRTHPTFAAAAAYLDKQAESVEFRSEPSGNTDSAIHMAAHCLVWAGRAFDSLLAGRPLRRNLQQTARAIRSAPALPHRLPVDSGHDRSRPTPDARRGEASAQ